MLMVKVEPPAVADPVPFEAVHVPVSVVNGIAVAGLSGLVGVGVVGVSGIVGVSGLVGVSDVVGVSGIVGVLFC